MEDAFDEYSMSRGSMAGKEGSGQMSRDFGQPHDKRYGGSVKDGRMDGGFGG